MQVGKSNSAGGRVSGCTCECECKGDCGEREWESKRKWKSVRTGVSEYECRMSVRKCTSGGSASRE